MKAQTKLAQQTPRTEEESRRLAGLLGPTIMVLTASEAMNYRIFEAQVPTVVYLNGLVLFVAGLSIVRRHNRWTWSWPVINTILGWVVLLAGLTRMFAPEAQQPRQSVAMDAFLAAGFGVGCYLTYKGYRRGSRG
jgi:hypothetical protein